MPTERSSGLTAAERAGAEPGPPGERPRPSTWTAGPWITCLPTEARGPQEDGAHTGKWLLFVPIPTVDGAWEVIRTETEAGRLGCRSKVSTALRAPDQVVLDEGQRVIAVFTYDSRDLADVRRVRERLRQLGYTDRIAYKTNAATRARLYGRPDDLRVHLLFE